MWVSKIKVLTTVGFLMCIQHIWTVWVSSFLNGGIKTSVLVQKHQFYIFPWRETSLLQCGLRYWYPWDNSKRITTPMVLDYQTASCLRVGSNPPSNIPRVILPQSHFSTPSESKSWSGYIRRWMFLYLSKTLVFTYFYRSNNVTVLRWSDTYIPK